jgi:hypothetical protein
MRIAYPPRTRVPLRPPASWVLWHGHARGHPAHAPVHPPQRDPSSSHSRASGDSQSGPTSGVPSPRAVALRRSGAGGRCQGTWPRVIRLPPSRRSWPDPTPGTRGRPRGLQDHRTGGHAICRFRPCGAALILRSSRRGSHRHDIRKDAGREIGQPGHPHGQQTTAPALRRILPTP